MGIILPFNYIHIAVRNRIVGRKVKISDTLNKKETDPWSHFLFMYGQM